MKRVITLDDETENGKAIMAWVQNLHDPVVSVSAPFIPLTTEEWATPGMVVNDAQVEYLLNRADEGSTHADDIIDEYTKRK